MHITWEHMIWELASHITKIKFLFFGFWTIPSSAWGLLLALHLDIAPSSLGKPYELPGIEPGFVQGWLSTGWMPCAVLSLWHLKYLLNLKKLTVNLSNIKFTILAIFFCCCYFDFGATPGDTRGLFLALYSEIILGCFRGVWCAGNQIWVSYMPCKYPSITLAPLS